MRTKGFTMIELVVAIATLFTGITAYGIVSSGAMKSYRANRTKISNLNYADTVANVFKANGKLMAKSIFDANVKDGKASVSYFIYFDNIQQLEDSVNAGASTALVAPSVPVSDIGSYNACLSARQGNKKNGVFISISRLDEIAKYKINDGSPDNNYNVNMYGVFVKTWNFETGSSSEVSLKLFLSR